MFLGDGRQERRAGHEGGRQVTALEPERDRLKAQGAIAEGAVVTTRQSRGPRQRCMEKWRRQGKA
jgi:hypothetical protein